MNAMYDDDPRDAELTRLADGSLPGAQAADLRDRVSRSPELQTRVREQQHAVALTRAASQMVAPATVHAAVRGLIAARSPRADRRSARPAWRPRVLAPLAAAGLAAIVLVVALLSGGPRSLTVARTAQLALAAPTRDAPGEDPSDPDLLSLRVDSIAFPAYESRSDWRATGARTDQVDGRRVRTVFYDIAGQRVGYSIVPGAALRVLAGDQHTIDGVRYTTDATGSTEWVTWRRDGHTCVIAGRRVSMPTLLRLAQATQITT